MAETTPAKPAGEKEREAHSLGKMATEGLIDFEELRPRLAALEVTREATERRSCALCSGARSTWHS
jgi:hypothetical protein